MLKRLGVALFFVILPAEFLVANDVLHVGKPADAGMSAEMLQQGLKLFEDAVEKDDIRGAVLLVARNGKIVFHEAVGWRNKETQLPMQPDSLFRMASNTKAFVATAVMMLSEEGKLSPDDLLYKHLSAFDNEKFNEIKIRHLLSHTSGLRIKTLFLEPLMKKSSEFPDAPTLQLEVNLFAGVGPKFPPGTTYSYNNPGYNTLGAVVEVESGKLL
jgi:CubicO group peptidase (beta-lactamase class C family)